MPPLSRGVPPPSSPASAIAGGHGHGSRKDGSRKDGSRKKSSCASRYGLPSRLSRAQSLQFKPSAALTFCPHIIFSGMVSALADHALVLLIVSLRAQWRAKAAGGLQINAEYAQDSHCR